MAPFFFILLASVFARLASATLYTVGGPAGWTLPSRAKLNYTEWSENTDFKIGDILEFNYVPKAHTVLEVTRTDFRYCNISNPLTKFDDASGKTTVTLTNPGNYYFIDGVGQHCEEGQKFQARVTNGSSSHSPSSSIASSPSSGFNPSLVPSSSPSSLEPALGPSAAIPPAVAAAPATSPPFCRVTLTAAFAIASALLHTSSAFH
ncbi:hypothetical protein KP509_32G073300 [Ceratopteris richardii]|uniref:Phytocyanin domain-containing protein n=1 Tax=Ceratopteris richardii TaxID=49495 RepID=A0A8T2QV48_CERRI|nr:hypothetical protein KP509_32G073300 [Ceratopteris richardii]